MLGFILFKVFLSDLFLLINDANFASNPDDNTIYDTAERFDNHKGSDNHILH